MCELVGLCKSLDYANLYVEHNDEVEFIECINNGNESDDNHSDCMADYEYDTYGLMLKIRKLLELEREKKMHEEVLADFERLRDKSGENW